MCYITLGTTFFHVRFSLSWVVLVLHIHNRISKRTTDRRHAHATAATETNIETKTIHDVADWRDEKKKRGEIRL